MGSRYSTRLPSRPTCALARTSHSRISAAAVRWPMWWVAVADHGFFVGWSVVVVVVVEGEVVVCVADGIVGAGEAVVMVVWIGWLSFACDSPW